MDNKLQPAESTKLPLSDLEYQMYVLLRTQDKRLREMCYGLELSKEYRELLEQTEALFQGIALKYSVPQLT